jgi:hypothetical protein
MEKYIEQMVQQLIGQMVIEHGIFMENVIGRMAQQLNMQKHITRNGGFTENLIEQMAQQLIGQIGIRHGIFTGNFIV